MLASSFALQVTATRQRIQESMKEMEAHKAKRLAARSEMINLAKVTYVFNTKLLHWSVLFVTLRSNS